MRKWKYPYYQIRVNDIYRGIYRGPIFYQQNIYKKYIQ